MGRKCRTVSLEMNKRHEAIINTLLIKCVTYSFFEEQIRWEMRFGSLVCAKL